MAGEFTDIVVELKYKKGGVRVPAIKLNQPLGDQSGTGDAESDSGTVKIGTSEEDVTFTDITTPGWLVLKFADPANSTSIVRYGPKDAGALIRFGVLSVNAKIALVYLDGEAPVTLRMISIGSEAKVQFWVFGQ